MERVGKILAHTGWILSIRRVNVLEKNREFCCHGTNHLLTVARLGYIDILERGLPIAKDVMYAAGLLHDVGKYLQYEENIPHHQSGAAMADPILADCGYDEQERRQICSAIQNHSSKGGLLGDVQEDSLDEVLYRADKASRNCMWCKAREKCDWPEERKRQGLIS